MKNNQILKKFSRLNLLKLILAVAFIASGTVAMGQKRTVTGTVSSAADQLPLPGVNVQVKGTTTGTITNGEGQYQISVASNDAILVFSFVGFKRQELKVGSLTAVNVVLEEDVAGLEEIAVVGYGTQKKVNLSGAVDRIESKELENRAISNVSQGLQGLVPNLNIDYMSGEPGQAAMINIRGITSINEGEPLILIDGVPVSSEELIRVNPADVESISVLKDASSAAIYGARAAFGVILITTKRGTREGMQVSYRNNFSWSKPTILPNKITDPYIYLRLLETSTDNTPWDNQNFSDETYLWAKQRSEDPSLPGVRVNPNDATSWEYMGDKDWTHYFLSDYTFSNSHHLSVQGRSDKTSYYLSGGFDDQSGALKIATDRYSRYNLRSQVNYNLSDWIKIGNNTLLQSTEREKPYHFSMWDIYNLFPTDWDINPDGTWANTAVGDMGASLTEGGDHRDLYNSFLTTFTGEMSVFRDMLKINADVTFRRDNNNVFSDNRKYMIGYGPDDVREVGNNVAYRTVSFNNYNVFNLYGTFFRDFGTSQFTAIAGFNQEENRYEWLHASKEKVISSSLPSIALATGEDYTDEYIAEWAIRGAFYRLNYVLNDKYIFELNGRYDGSSKFPKENRFGFFPSASAAWRLDHESFMSGLKPVVSLLKPRVSYGSLGNQFVSEYGYIPTMNASQASLIIGGSRPMQVTPPSLVSSNYTWEKVSSVNLGVDLGLFDNRFTATFDWYTRDTRGMLTQGKDLPDVLGAGEPNENAADLRTQGWELTMVYKHRGQLSGKPFMANARFVLSDSRSWITRFDNPNQNLVQYYEGMELGEIWGLTSDGLFKTEEEIAALDETQVIPWGALSIVPGWPKYVDQDGNKIIETGLTVDDPKDLSIIGNSTPRYRYGFNFDFTWEGFDLRLFLQGVGKRDYYPLDYLYWGFYQQPYAGGYAHLTDFYRGEDDSQIDRDKHSQSYIDAGLADANLDAFYPIMQAWLADRNLGERIDQAKGLAIPQTAYLLDASYLRIKNITIGYTLPVRLYKNKGIENIRVYVSGENLYEWSKVKAYYDPEAINDAVKIDPGADVARGSGKGYAYPFQRYYSAGINVTF